jgi:hypothetical protein
MNLQKIAQLGRKAAMTKLSGDKDRNYQVLRRTWNPDSRQASFDWQDPLSDAGIAAWNAAGDQWDEEQLIKKRWKQSPAVMDRRTRVEGLSPENIDVRRRTKFVEPGTHELEDKRHLEYQRSRAEKQRMANPREKAAADAVAAEMPKALPRTQTIYPRKGERPIDAITDRLGWPRWSTSSEHGEQMGRELATLATRQDENYLQYPKQPRERTPSMDEIARRGLYFRPDTGLPNQLERQSKNPVPGSQQWKSERATAAAQHAFDEAMVKWKASKQRQARIEGPTVAPWNPDAHWGPPDETVEHWKHKGNQFLDLLGL